MEDDEYDHDYMEDRPENKSQEMVLTDLLQMETDSTTIIRMIEELLTITRALKESWILNQLPNSVEDGLEKRQSNESSICTNLDARLNELLSRICEVEDSYTTMDNYVLFRENSS
ncbi:Srb6p ASCRUDRAFT_74803 [Ascoidea rubescens DSM 1968]|uniref:Mediator of RNA polymerase II transcription subunit 22 n=1 Tax=Ascoidea rubescens DSM 1968 TaxID=1344418 RepID=A0A1D2VLE6_9ASCO|nr:hypothetical protein ASCRUDRAFT_74803 [Ascoidea rubescens DSM 1968]ODV62422.1 hypothetical protein ASCRUDRAFT_74803 [Ascoidea rubescens DSM 1968]